MVYGPGTSASLIKIIYWKQGRSAIDSCGAVPKSKQQKPRNVMWVNGARNRGLSQRMSFRMIRFSCQLMRGQYISSRSEGVMCSPSPPPRPIYTDHCAQAQVSALQHLQVFFLYDVCCAYLSLLFAYCLSHVSSLVQCSGGPSQRDCLRFYCKHLTSLAPFLTNRFSPFLLTQVVRWKFLILWGDP